MNRIAVVGILDDGPDSLTSRARRVVEAAEVLAGGRRHLAFFPEVGAERMPLQGDLNAAVEGLRAAWQAGRRTVVLASGDPLFYGIGRLLVQRLGREALIFYPNVSSVALACARIGQPWEEATVASFHGREAAGVAELVQGRELVVLLTDGVNTPTAIARRLLMAGVTGYTAHVCANLGSAAEEIWEGDLAATAGREFPPLNVLVLRHEAWGQPAAE